MPSDRLPATNGDHPRPLWQWYAALAAPFVLCLLIVFVSGKPVQNPSAISDEPPHWRLTLLIAEHLPHFDPIYGDSATAPLFHLLGAIFVRGIGPHLPLARVLNTAFSLVAVFGLFALLRRAVRHTPPTAALLTAVFLSSCYFFAYSFRWLTDNLALTFCILTMGQLFRFADPEEPRRMRAFGFACLWYACAILTRQNYAFLGLPLALTLLGSGLPRRAIAAGLLGIALALLPFAGLVGAWHGLVPPSFQKRHVGAPVNLYALALPLMLLGFYAPFFEGPGFWRLLRTPSAPRFRWLLLAVGIGLAVVWRFPLAPVVGHKELTPYFPAVMWEADAGAFSGWLYNVADRLPKPRHNSIVFWVLLPAGLWATGYFLSAALERGRDPLRRTAVFFLLGLLISSTLNQLCIQLYYDGCVLLFLVWHLRGEVAREPWRRAALVALILLFCSYFAVYPWTVKPHPPASASVPQLSAADLSDGNPEAGIQRVGDSLALPFTPPDARPGWLAQRE